MLLNNHYPNSLDSFDRDYYIAERCLQMLTLLSDDSDSDSGHLGLDHHWLIMALDYFKSLGLWVCLLVCLKNNNREGILLIHSFQIAVP